MTRAAPVWLAGLLAVTACSFSGAAGGPSGEPEADAAQPDAMPADGPEVLPDAPPTTLTCADFKEIEGARYRLFPEVVDKASATARCNSISGAHLVTFETLEEITKVVEDYPIEVKVWTAIKQDPRFGSGPGDRWANQVGATRTDLPANFPWKSGEPNDGNGFYFEDNAENEGALDRDGKFDDVHHSNNKYQTLCECPDDGGGD